MSIQSIQLLKDISTYPLSELLLRWQQDRLTAEQLIGHLLQHLIAQEARIQQLEKAKRSQ